MSRPNRIPRITPDDSDNPSRFSEFTGVVNTRSRKDIGLKALYVGDNVVITDTKKVARRAGYSLLRAGVISAFGLSDWLYAVTAEGALLRLASPTDERTLVTGLTGTDYDWADINGTGYFVNGVDAGIVRGDQYLPWRLTPPIGLSVVAVDAGTLPATTLNVGATYVDATWRFCATYETADGRETAPSDVFELHASPATKLFRVTVPTGYARTNVYVTEPDGTVFRLASSSTYATVTILPAAATRELTTYNDSPLPTGVYQIEFFQGRCFAAEYVPQQDVTIVWISEPLAFHLFNQGKDFFLLPGKLGVLIWCNDGMIWGTTNSIYQYKENGELNLLVEYGVIPGMPGDTDAESVAYFWTERGFCKAMPFENLSEKSISMAPGLRAASRMVYINGLQQFITVTQGGGLPFNQRTER